MALTPEELKAISESFNYLFDGLNQFIIEDFARRVAKVGNVTDSAKLQAIRANEIGMSVKAIEEEVARVLDLTIEQVEDMFMQASIHSLDRENELYKKAGYSPLKIEKHPRLEQIVKGAIKQTNSEMKNLTMSLGFIRFINGKAMPVPIKEFYHSSLDLATMKIQSGVTDYNTAIRQAVKGMADSGVRYIDYESGWSNKLDVAVRRAVLTGSNQMAQKITIAGMEENDYDFVETTAHIGARPSHKVWQGKVFSFSGKSNKYPSFIEVTGYGTGDGLGGWNCRHSFHPFDPSYSTKTYTEKELKNIDPEPFEFEGKTYTYYEASQKQREIERAIRKTKTELAGYDAAGLKDDFTNTSIKLKRQEQFYKEFSKASNIPQEKDRLQALGFNKSISQKSVWADKNSSKNLIHEEIRITREGRDENSNEMYYVNRKLVNSKEYHDKFEQLPLNKKVKERIYVNAKKMLEHRDGYPYEDLVILDSRTGKEIISNTSNDEELRTGVSKEDYEKAINNPNNIILLHNHPGGGRFSITDIITAFNTQNVSGTIVAGHDGSIHYINEINRNIDIEKEFNKIYNEFKGRGIPSSLAKLKANDSIYEKGYFKYIEF